MGLAHRAIPQAILLSSWILLASFPTRTRNKKGMQLFVKGKEAINRETIGWERIEIMTRPRKIYHGLSLLGWERIETIKREAIGWLGKEKG